MKKMKQIIQRVIPLTLMLLCCSLTALAQRGIEVTGEISDEAGEPVIGASVIMKGNASVGTVSDFDGRFRLSVPSEQSVIAVSYLGMITQELRVGTRRSFKVTLREDRQQLEEVIVVGYGQQKKASVVGSITQTDSKTLERYAGVTSLGQALTGNLPGVITTQSTGMPGDDDPKIVIRTQTSWNNSDPLVLVDGIERPMSSVDLASVATVSVLKDASATAVYGVKGANGVILITTKRGQEGKASVHAKANATMKLVSKLPSKYDSYNTFLVKNNVTSRELPLFPGNWGNFKPMEIINKYRYPLNDEEWERYPNVDWEDVLFKDYAMSYNASVDVSGGTKLVKYFAAVDFANEGDMFKDFKNARGYQTGFNYNRLNLRANLDINLTNTTTLSMNLFGSNGVRRTPWSQDGNSFASAWASVYRSAPDAMRPIYRDGIYGFYSPRNADVPNSVKNIATDLGSEKITTMKINTDFILQQDLSMITKGLSFKGDFSYDNTMVENHRGVNDLYHNALVKWIDPESGIATYEPADKGLDYIDPKDWTIQGGEVNRNATYRRIYYSLQLNYARQFGLHDMTALALFSRDDNATGSEFHHYREDWVFRLTYNYAMRYFAEVNGAYNGSEKFSNENRFAFFPSFSVGWMLTEEPFMKKTKGWLDMFKFRGSWGRIGDDNIGGRWLYRDEWSQGGKAMFGTVQAESPYTFFTLSRLGNPNISWETVEKRNFGVDYAFLGGLIAGSFDIFSDKRTDILIGGGSRAVPTYFGATAPSANLGEVKSHGWELAVRLNKVFNNKLRLWGNFNMTHGVNEVVSADDPDLKAAYRKQQGYAIGQYRSYIDHGYIQNWDELYGSTWRLQNNDNKLVGDYLIADFNADGQINDDDQAPYQYSGTPQNTFSATVGAEWKGFSFSLQFYGVNNVTREITFPTFHSTANVVYDEGTYWSPATGSGDVPMPRWSAVQGGDANGTRYLYDGSFIRLKNAELAYTFTGNWVQKAGLKNLRLYLNGTNLLLWTDMPDDRESNFSGGSSSGAYPTVKRINLGVDLTF